jgi:hypothetical protein
LHEIGLLHGIFDPGTIAGMRVNARAGGAAGRGVSHVVPVAVRKQNRGEAASTLSQGG